MNNRSCTDRCPVVAVRNLAGFPVGQRLDPAAQGDVLALGGGLVPLPLSGRNPDVYTHAGGVCLGGLSPRPFGRLFHAPIMYSQIILDNPFLS
jgi:hypothetical protein